MKIYFKKKSIMIYFQIIERNINCINHDYYLFFILLFNFLPSHIANFINGQLRGQ